MRIGIAPSEEHVCRKMPKARVRACVMAHHGHGPHATARQPMRRAAAVPDCGALRCAFALEPPDAPGHFVTTDNAACVLACQVTIH